MLEEKVIDGDGLVLQQNAAMPVEVLQADGLVAKRPIAADTFICLGFMALAIGYCSHVMGLGNFINTLMNSGHYLVLNLAFYVLALGGITGALSAIMGEFGVIALINKVISPLMRPVYGLPGAASIGVMATFVSDSPAIVSCAKEEKFIKYFKPYQRPVLCNLGMAYGMGLIVVSFMIAQNIEGGIRASLVGLVCAILGSIVSVRLMYISTTKYYGIGREELKNDRSFKNDFVEEDRRVNPSTFERVLMTLLNGAKNGMQLGFDVLPAILTICLIVLTLTWGPGPNGYDGSAAQGVALLPRLGDFLLPVTRFLFGFEHGSDVVFPLTAMGTVGAAIGLVPAMKAAGTINANDIAVFTAMGMCWSGYMSNCAAMMDALGTKQFIKPVIWTHTVGGLVAGIAAHFLMVFLG